MRPLPDIAKEHRDFAREKLDSFVQSELPHAEYPRILLASDVATEISQFARTGGFDP